MKIPDKTAGELISTNPGPHLRYVLQVVKISCEQADIGLKFDAIHPESSYKLVACSMCAGEFIEVYSKEPQKWDSVVSCFFLDTAPNVFDYVRTIFEILKPGGLWVNHGPLLWHWYAPEYTSIRSREKVDRRYDESLEFGYNELKEIILSYGFEFVHESWHTCKYSSDPLSMQATVYQTVLFTCKKPDVSFA